MGLQGRRFRIVMVRHLFDNSPDNIGDTAAPATMGSTDRMMLLIVKQHGLTVGLLNHQTGTGNIRNQPVVPVHLNIDRPMASVGIYPAAVNLACAYKPLYLHLLFDVRAVLLYIHSTVPGPEPYVETGKYIAADTTISIKKSIGNHSLLSWALLIQKRISSTCISWVKQGLIKFNKKGVCSG